MGWNEVGSCDLFGNISYSNLLPLNFFFSFATKRRELKKKEKGKTTNKNKPWAMERERANQ